MRRPSQKATLFFIVALGAGYAISVVLMTVVLQAPLRLYGFANLSLVAILIAVLITIWLDKPFGLDLFKWREKPPRAEEEVTPQPEAAVTETTPLETPEIPSGAGFPHEVPSEHWQADFGDSKQVYEGSALPIWILAGWATFILWAVIYLISGLPGAF